MCSGAGPTHSPKRFHQDAGLAVPAGSGSNTLQARISTDSSEIPPPPLPESSTQRGGQDSHQTHSARTALEDDVDVVTACVQMLGNFN